MVGGMRLDEIGRPDVAFIEDWDRSLPEEDTAVLAALAAADRAADVLAAYDGWIAGTEGRHCQRDQHE